MGNHLAYWWMIAVRFAGQHYAVHPRRVQNKWKPVIVFAKPPVGKAPEWLSDLLDGGGRDKEHHDWGQDESEAEYLIRHLTEPDSSWWTRSAAAVRFLRRKALGRRWLATEEDRATDAGGEEEGGGSANHFYARHSVCTPLMSQGKILSLFKEIVPLACIEPMND